MAINGVTFGMLSAVDGNEWSKIRLAIISRWQWMNEVKLDMLLAVDGIEQSKIRHAISSRWHWTK